MGLGVPCKADDEVDSGSGIGADVEQDACVDAAATWHMNTHTVSQPSSLIKAEKITGCNFLFTFAPFCFLFLALAVEITFWAILAGGCNSPSLNRFIRSSRKRKENKGKAK